MYRDKKVKLFQWLYQEFYEDMILAGMQFIRPSYPNREDMVHDAVVSVFQTAYDICDDVSLSAHPNLRGWIYKTLYNRLRNQLDKAFVFHRKTSAFSEENLKHVAQVDVFDQWATNEEHRQILEQLKSIRKTPQDEVIYHEYFIEEKSSKQIAAELDLTEGAVKAKIYRMRKRAKKLKALMFSMLLHLAWFMVSF